MYIFSFHIYIYINKIPTHRIYAIEMHIVNVLCIFSLNTYTQYICILLFIYVYNNKNVYKNTSTYVQ